MKIVLTGGGTAGHVNPALGIASILKKNDPDCKIDYIGTSDHLESKLVPKAGYPIHYIEVYGLKRSLSLQNVKTAWKTVTSIRACKKLLKELRPDAVVGTGGYVCFPVCYAAAKLHIPVALHESNAEPGFAVKMLKKKADLIFVNFQDTEKYLAGATGKIIHSGMPIQQNFYKNDKKNAKKEVGCSEYAYRLLSFGGSLGASHLNREMLVFIRDYMSKHEEVSLIHAVGSRDYAAISEQFKEMKLDKLKNVTLTEYIYDMPVQMAAADLVICRSGAATLSELSAMKKASVLIPSPNVTNNQQYKNAKLLADADAALLIEDGELTADALVSKIDSVLTHPQLLQKMEQAVSTFTVKNTEVILYNELKQLVMPSEKGEKEKNI
jgi:UDP-N-acetylglucosamine--N-acetylmuramyl-(pentapeptide) pyrophosphoryl-undecaprenol N-acetylglucosamine transferase